MIIVEKDKCCGCGNCSIACKYGAVHMEADSEGFLYPIIHDDLCKKCNSCIIACPIIQNNNVRLSSYKDDVYMGYFSDIGELISCASGGAASAISKKIIYEGGTVFGSVYTKDYKGAYITSAETIEQLNRFRGSKYIQSDKADAFLQVKNLLKEERIVLYIGLPCEIGALKTFLHKDYCTLYTMELICHGPTSQLVAKEFICGLEKRYHSKIVDFSVRYKKDGWIPAYLRAEFANKKCFLRPFYSTDYGYAFSILTRPSCYCCHFKGDNRVADVTIGDYWGLKETDEHYNKYGVSIIFVHTPKGEKLIDNLQGFELYKTELSNARMGNPMIYRSKERPANREQFSKLFVNKGLFAACLQTKPIKTRIQESTILTPLRVMKVILKNVYKKVLDK